MVTSPPDDDAILATLYELLEAGSMTHAAFILKSAEASIQKTGYDNWNGDPISTPSSSRSTHRNLRGSVSNGQ